MKLFFQSKLIKNLLKKRFLPWDFFMRLRFQNCVSKYHSDDIIMFETDKITTLEINYFGLFPITGDVFIAYLLCKFT